MTKRQKNDTAVSLEAPCPSCLSPRHSRCTIATSTGRKPVAWFHYGRREAGIAMVEKEAQQKAFAEDFPEHAKLDEIENDREVIKKFLLWLSGMGYTIAERGVPETRLEEVDRSVPEWIMEFFEVDSMKLIQEREKMATLIRKAPPFGHDDLKRD